MAESDGFFGYVKKHGLAKTLQAVACKINPIKEGPPKILNAKNYLGRFKRLSGIEVGGPSAFFQSVLPIYKVVASLDCVDFSAKTLWHSSPQQGTTYRYYKDRTGYQYICDAVDMTAVESGKYDFCLSCNVLEHIANPLKAVSQWLRTIKDDGLLLLVVPKKESNFDHNRPTTTFEHLRSDYEKNMDEHDLSHLPEILRLHDLSMDLAAGSPSEFKLRSEKNFENRALHQHVFDMEVLKEICQFFSLEVLECTTIKTDYVLLAKKRKAAGQ